jgi:hypothetical protein
VRLSALPQVLRAHRWIDETTTPSQRKRTAQKEVKVNFLVKGFRLNSDDGDPNLVIERLTYRGEKLIIAGSDLTSILENYLEYLPRLLDGADIKQFFSLAVSLRVIGCNPFSEESVSAFLQKVRELEQSEKFKADVAKQLTHQQQVVSAEKEFLELPDIGINQYFEKYYNLVLYDEPRLNALLGYAKALDFKVPA